MDSTFLRHIIEQFPDQKFRSIGSFFLADCVQVSYKFSFALIITSSRNEAGNQWIMIAGLNKNYYCADSLARPIRHKKAFEKRASEKDTTSASENE